MKKVLVSVNSSDSTVKVICDMANVKSKADYTTCLKAMFNSNDFEIDENGLGEEVEWFRGVPLADVVDNLKSSGYAELDSDSDVLQVIDVSKAKDPFAKKRKTR